MAFCAQCLHLAGATQQCNHLKRKAGRHLRRGTARIRGIRTLQASNKATCGGARNSSLNIPARNRLIAKLRIPSGIVAAKYWVRGAMHEIAALLAKLQQIAGWRCCCDERSARAVALVSAFSATLYDRLSIASSNRPTSGAKATADQTLVELRRQILALEMRQREPRQAAFTAARHRVEMERRVLVARIAAGADSPPLPPSDIVAEPRPGSLKPSPSLDRQLLVAMRRRLGDRALIVRSHAAIADSLRLLGLCPLEAACLGG